MNKVELSGTVFSMKKDQDLEIQTTAKGHNYFKFCLKVNNEFGSPSFINCTAWGELAHQMFVSCKKFADIRLVGQISTSTYTDKNNNKRYSMEVIPSTFALIRSGTGESTAEYQAQQQFKQQKEFAQDHFSNGQALPASGISLDFR